MNGDIQLPRFRDCFLPRRRLSVPAARTFVRKALSEWAVRERFEDVTLCVSELATNAVVHGVPPGRGFRVLVWLDHDGLCRVEVHDSGPGWPQIPEVDDELEAGGRGLRLVAELADKWGVERRDPGKIVWVEFGL
ncbi:ATPase [Streptomyces abyssalis]|uniref:ATPase n=1 Tax=Streptomyces abyssalis TaxID=933944 RepID=A0A1E7JJ82_9ACTN|nr:ATP-binding protein [Streptomyces abyssalis]OEU87182.1 ATPase [Streptomyces abyssalis]OEU87716.1 ATPase [Streptomyces abyssalis]OEV26714.1 ATPase [Streptomyces nanshensis]